MTLLPLARMRAVERLIIVVIPCLVACGANQSAPSPSSIPPLQQVSLAGIVRDIDSGAPISGATVFFEKNLGSTTNAGTETVSGPDGRYLFDHITVGNANIRAAADGYQSWVKGANISASTTLDLDLRKVDAPLVHTGAIGGSPQTWTCTMKVPQFRDVQVDVPCQSFPLTMRRSGYVSVTLAWNGASAPGMVLQIVTASGLIITANNGVPHNPLDASAFLNAGNATVRFYYQPPNQAIVSFTLTVARSD